jgi:hypothetical protein
MNNKIIPNKYKNIFFILLSFLYALLLSSYPNEFFRDRENYIVYAINFDIIADNYPMAVYFFNEPLFLLYNKFFSFFVEPEVVPKVSVFFIAFTISFLILKKSRDPFFAILGFCFLFFISYTFHLQLVVLRQGVATALFLWLVYFFDREKKFYPLCFLLSFFHISFFIVFLVIFYDHILSRFISKKTLRVFIIFISILFSSFFALKIAGVMEIRQSSEEHLLTNSSGGGGFVLFLFLSFFMFLRGFNNVYSDSYGRIALLGFVTYLAFYFTLPISGRIIGTFLPFYYIYYVSSGNKKTFFSGLVFLIVCNALFYVTIINSSLTSVGVSYLQRLL